jgi:hypothetical protein
LFLDWEPGCPLRYSRCTRRSANTDRDSFFFECRQLENGNAIDGDFDLKLRLCAMQRLMQALGAYGFLGLVKGHKHFLKYTPNALSSLRAVVATIESLQPLASFLAEV